MNVPEMDSDSVWQDPHSLLEVGAPRQALPRDPPAELGIIEDIDVDGEPDLDWFA